MGFVQRLCGPVRFPEGCPNGGGTAPASVHQFRSLAFRAAMHIRCGTDFVFVVVDVSVCEFVDVVGGSFEPILVDDCGLVVFDITAVVAVVIIGSRVQRCINLDGHVEFVGVRFVVGRRWCGRLLAVELVEWRRIGFATFW